MKCESTTITQHRMGEIDWGESQNRMMLFEKQ